MLYNYLINYVNNLLYITSIFEIYNVVFVNILNNFKIRFCKTYIRNKY